jgi:hypothetical protein
MFVRYPGVVKVRCTTQGFTLCEYFGKEKNFHFGLRDFSCILIRGDAIKYSEWPPYRNCTILEHQQRCKYLHIRAITSNTYRNVK